MRDLLLLICSMACGCSASGAGASVIQGDPSSAGSSSGIAGDAASAGSAATSPGSGGSGGSLMIDVPPQPMDKPTAETCDGKLTAIIRDFQPTHPDFEFKVPGTNNHCYCPELGIVSPQLGSDQKPVYLGGMGKTTSTQANFDQWYRDVPGINQRMELSLQFTQTDAGTFVYDSSPPGAAPGVVANKAYPGFFPIDGQLFGNSGNDDWGQPHNYHFTLELVSAFVYKSGDVFRFRGDDDVWVFIDNKLVVDLGGIHTPESAVVQLDSLGLTPGETYPLHFFYAERHVTGSNFRMETSLRFVDCKPPQ